MKLILPRQGTEVERNLFWGARLKPHPTTKALGPRIPRWTISRIFHLVAQTPAAFLAHHDAQEQICWKDGWCHRSRAPSRLTHVWYLWERGMQHSGWNSNLALAYQTHANRAHSSGILQNSPGWRYSSDGDFSNIHCDSSPLYKLPAWEMK